MFMGTLSHFSFTNGTVPHDYIHVNIHNKQVIPVPLFQNNLKESRTENIVCP
jgi:hypothetical protein